VGHDCTVDRWRDRRATGQKETTPDGMNPGQTGFLSHDSTVILVRLMIGDGTTSIISC
jgi:hypothetical protein